MSNMMSGSLPASIGDLGTSLTLVCVLVRHARDSRRTMLGSLLTRSHLAVVIVSQIYSIQQRR
jgi:hypothetical protein